MNPSAADLAAYLERIDQRVPLRPDYATLATLHLAHASHIPFENLDVLAGRTIRLDLASLQAKLVAGGRGGYCFEHNLLFAAMLRRLGFPVRQLAARVRYRTTRLLPRTHMLLLVEADGGDWLADVGFGGEGLLLPVPFGSEAEVRHFAWTYRLRAADGEWLLQSGRAGGWQDLYSFTLEEQQQVDYEMANHYVSTHPDSRFLHTLTVQLPTPEGRHILIDRDYIVDRGATATQRTLADEGEVRELLETVFKLPGVALGKAP